MRSLLRKIINLPSYVWGPATLFIVALAAYLVPVLYDEPLPQNVFWISALPLFVVTIVELARNRRVHAAALIRTHMSEFLANKEMYETYHDLIYNYSDAEWKKADATTEKHKKDCQEKVENVTPEMRNVVWKALNPSGDAPDGKRRYHPMFFQGSLEERRLDKIMHFFDLIAYQYRRRVIEIQDVSGIAGYYLGVIGTREVIRYYLALNAKEWSGLPYQTAVGTEPPFTNLKRLLKDLEKWQKKRTGRRLRQETTKA